MRMTLHDLAKLLRRELNRFLRLGLLASGEPAVEPFVIHPRPLGLPPGLNYDQVEDLIEALETRSTGNYSRRQSAAVRLQLLTPSIPFVLAERFS